MRQRIVRRHHVEEGEGEIEIEEVWKSWPKAAAERRAEEFTMGIHQGKSYSIQLNVQCFFCKPVSVQHFAQPPRVSVQTFLWSEVYFSSFSISTSSNTVFNSWKWASKGFMDMHTRESGFAVPSSKKSWPCGSHITSNCGHNYSISKYALSESLVVFHKTARLSNCDCISQHGVMETAPLLMFLYYLYLIPRKEILPHPLHSLQGQIHATVRARFLITDWVVSIQDCHKESVRSSICQSHTSLTSEPGHFNDPFLRLNADRTVFISFHRRFHSEIQTRPSAALQGLTSANKCMWCTETKKCRPSVRERRCSAPVWKCQSSSRTRRRCWRILQRAPCLDSAFWSVYIRSGKPENTFFFFFRLPEYRMRKREGREINALNCWINKHGFEQLSRAGQEQTAWREN